MTAGRHMAIETKAAVAIDGISEPEAGKIFRLFGYEPTSVTRLYGGYSSSNFKVVGVRSSQHGSRRGGWRGGLLDRLGAALCRCCASPCTTSCAGSGKPATLLLKVCYYGLSIEDLQHQIFVLGHLKTVAFPTNYPHAATDGRMLVESDGKRAMLLDFIGGARPGQELLAEDEGLAPSLLRELSLTLARLHQVKWPRERELRDVRSGFPVCNTGDLLAGEALEKLEAEPRFAAHAVVALARESLEWLRELYARDLPWGLIHGDGFLDNVMYQPPQEGGRECKLRALLDWEDSCVGPLVLDLAVAASACCFTASNELLATRLAVLLKAYHGERPLSALERQSLPDFMAAGALACAFYRFCEFNVRQPDSDVSAKGSYQLMLDRARHLKSGEARSVVQAAVAELAP